MNSPIPCTPPDIIHQTAFNLCAVLAASREPVHLFSGHLFYADHMICWLETLPDHRPNHRPPVLIWAAPRPGEWPRVADRLQEFPPGAVVLVLTAGRAGRRWVRRVAGPEGSAEGYLSPATVARLLTGQGFRPLSLYGIGGLAYRLYARLAYLSALLRWDDRADRFTARARNHLVTTGRFADCSLLVVLVARR